MNILAACHVHSDWSYDGSWSLDRLTAAFRSRGARVLMTTEHDRGFNDRRLADYRDACQRATSANLYVLPGIEYSDAANRVHVLVWGPVPFLGEEQPTEVVLEGAARHGGVAVLAHPSRRDAWQSVTASWTDRLLGIEAWNRKYDGWAPGKDAAALLTRTHCVPFVGLDFHTRRQMFPLGMTLDVEGTVDEASVIACLQQRRCAASAFGVPLSDLKRGLTMLRVAELGRSSLSAVKRYSTRQILRRKSRAATDLFC
jgi:hypothetical protein